MSGTPRPALDTSRVLNTYFTRPLPALTSLLTTLNKIDALHRAAQHLTRRRLATPVTMAETPKQKREREDEEHDSHERSVKRLA